MLPEILGLARQALLQHGLGHDRQLIGAMGDEQDDAAGFAVGGLPGGLAAIVGPVLPVGRVSA